MNDKAEKETPMSLYYLLHFQASTGGRITVFQTCLPSAGPGKLGRRELTNMSGNAKVIRCLIYLYACCFCLFSQALYLECSNILSRSRQWLSVLVKALTRRYWLWISLITFIKKLQVITYKWVLVPFGIFTFMSAWNQTFN